MYEANEDSNDANELSQTAITICNKCWLPIFITLSDCTNSSDEYQMQPTKFDRFSSSAVDSNLCQVQISVLVNNSQPPFNS